LFSRVDPCSLHRSIGCAFGSPYKTTWGSLVGRKNHCQTTKESLVSRGVLVNYKKILDTHLGVLVILLRSHWLARKVFANCMGILDIHLKSLSTIQKFWVIINCPIQTYGGGYVVRVCKKYYDFLLKVMKVLGKHFKAQPSNDVGWSIVT